MGRISRYAAKGRRATIDMLSGETACMVKLSMSEGNSNKAAFDGNTACSMKLVAGARYQRYLQISEGWLPRVS
jgi:hypothetical protein